MELQDISKKYEDTHTCLYQAEYLNMDNKTKKYTLLSRNHNLDEDTMGGDVNAVTMMILSKDNQRLLVSKEFRMAVNKVIVNFPGGLIDPGESIQIAAERELQEETGHTIESFISLPASYSAVGISDEKVAMVIGVVGVEEVPATPSPNEMIEKCWVTKNEALELLNEYDFSARAQLLTYLWANGMLNLK